MGKLNNSGEITLRTFTLHESDIKCLMYGATLSQ